MSREAGRHRYMAQARGPRDVSTDMRDRCAVALARHEGKLSEKESRALLALVAAHGLGARVNKSEIDLAAGILGRLNAK